jgi:hypothetical protein
MSMKTAVWSLLSLLLFTTVPLRAQRPPEGLQRAIELRGEEGVGGQNINGLAVGFSLNRDYHNVTVAARLANAGGIEGYAGGTAYLTRMIGLHSRSIHEVAKKEFELSQDYNGMFTLFTNLDLAAGEYWLVFEDPDNGRKTFANWLAAAPFVVRTTKGTHYLGTTESTFPTEAPTYMPATLVHEVNRNFGYQFEVIGEPVPLLKDEDPSRVTLR